MGVFYFCVIFGPELCHARQTIAVGMHAGDMLPVLTVGGHVPHSLCASFRLKPQQVTTKLQLKVKRGGAPASYAKIM